jgi:hypothetical protein
MSTFPSLQRGEGSCERIQFSLPSLVRRGSGGGRKSRYTNPLESPLTKGDTRKVIPKPIFSHLQGVGGKVKIKLSSRNLRPYVFLFKLRIHQQTLLCS